MIKRKKSDNISNHICCIGLVVLIKAVASLVFQLLFTELDFCNVSVNGARSLEDTFHRLGIMIILLHTKLIVFIC